MNTPDSIVADATSSSVISAADVADYLALDSVPSYLSAICDAATDMMSRYLGRDLNQRTWTVTYRTWPDHGTLTVPSVSRNLSWNLRDSIDALYSAGDAINVHSVTAYGEALTTDDYTVWHSSVSVSPRFGPTDDADEPALVIVYSTPWIDLPPAITLGVMNLVAYMFEHRGSCSVDDAIKQSGVATAVAQYRNPELFI